MKERGKPQEVTLTGIITPVEWDENDCVIAVALSTSDEEEYLIDDSDLGEELLEFTSQNVRVTGVLEEDEYGDKRIIVKRYKVFDDA
ncbi:MAG: hypothetical protein ACMUIA_01640 [bacterium]